MKINAIVCMCHDKKLYKCFILSYHFHESCINKFDFSFCYFILSPFVRSFLPSASSSAFLTSSSDFYYFIFIVLSTPFDDVHGKRHIDDTFFFISVSVLSSFITISYTALSIMIPIHFYLYGWVDGRHVRAFSPLQNEKCLCEVLFEAACRSTMERVKELTE